MKTALPSDLVSLSDYERHARLKLVDAVWAFLDGAGADGLTKAANRRAFDELRLNGRVLSDMSDAHTRTSFLGIDLDVPFLLAPVAALKLAHPDGEVAAVQAANATKVAMAVSTQANTSLEDVARLASVPLLFQLYFQQDRMRTLELAHRAEQAGYRALLLTVDAPVNGVRMDEARSGFRMPEHLQAVNLEAVSPPVLRNGPGESPVFRGLLDHAPKWADVEWLCAQTSLPVILKGILHPEDAGKALDHGADAIAVSNHGGRTLDTLPASLEALPAIAEQVDGRVPLLLDGGVRRGTDVIKALALGASAVMIGRPLVHALAVGGALGVAHMLSLLRAEVEVAMALTGFSAPEQIGPGALFRSRFS